MELTRDLEIHSYRLINFVNLGGADSERVLAWRNSYGVRRWTYTDHVITVAEHEAFIGRLREEGDSAYWLVRKQGEGVRDMGVISLTGIDWQAGKATLGIYANPDLKLPGLGRELMKCLLEVTFFILRLGRLQLEVLEDNTRAVDFYRWAGFREIGRLKERIFRGGRTMDALVMEITSEEVEIWK